MTPSTLAHLDSNVHLFAGTPSLAVRDPRGQTVRDIHYHRHPDTPTEQDRRITCHRFDPGGRLAASIDPRLATLALRDASVVPNVRYRYSLSDAVVQTDSVDAGVHTVLNDATGRLAIDVSATGVVHTRRYRPACPAHHLDTITEQSANAQPCVVERLVWADASPSQQAANLAGQCTHHYDTAGLKQTLSLSLGGATLADTWQVLGDEARANWHGDNAANWTALLAPEVFRQRCRVDALDAPLAKVDPRQHERRYAYDLAGQLHATALLVPGQAERPIMVAVHYSESGRPLRQTQGNGVVSDYEYDAHTQRLTRQRVARPANHPLGAKVLQDLGYRHDPVGNLVERCDASQAVRFWRNQRVEASSTFVYDTLYQLVSATGRERIDRGQQTPTPPTATVPVTLDDSAFTRYLRTYRHDRAGNLVQVRHSAPASGNNYTHHITVAARSNRAVPSQLTEDPLLVHNLFDAGGHQRQLAPGQGLQWNARGELGQVSPVTREGRASDTEWYRYDAQGKRRVKQGSQHGATQVQTHRTLYLDGLELHASATGEAVREAWQVISIDEAAHCQVRALCWEVGKPDGIDNGGLRYSYPDRVGSSGLELDDTGQLISQEEYYPYGGTAVWTSRSQAEARYKTVRYSGKECDATGLYYYGLRYYQPWAARWLSADPAGAIDGLNLFRMVRNNPMTLWDEDGLQPVGDELPNGLYKPVLRTGKARDRDGAKHPGIPADAQKQIKSDVKPIPLRDALSDTSLGQQPLVTDLLNPAKGLVSTADTATLNRKEGGGQLLFGALQVSSQGRQFNALTAVDPRTTKPQAAGEYAYWAPQGGYVDIPAHPSNGQPQLVFTPGFSGCTLAVDQLSADTLRVRHVEGGKEDAQYNSETIKHGLGMANAMEYRDYGYFQAGAGPLLESVQGTAFMQYDQRSKGWAIHHQSLLNTPQIMAVESRTTGFISKQVTQQATVLFSQDSRVARNSKIVLRNARP